MKKKDGASKSFQIKMDPDAHGLLKQRAQQLQITIGELIQNLLASMEKRVEGLKQTGGFEDSVRNDALDARLIRLMMLIDKTGLTDDEVKNKLAVIKDEFQYKRYQPDITIGNGNN